MDPKKIGKNIASFILGFIMVAGLVTAAGFGLRGCVRYYEAQRRAEKDAALDQDIRDITSQHRRQELYHAKRMLSLEIGLEWQELDKLERTNRGNADKDWWAWLDKKRAILSQLYRSNDEATSEEQVAELTAKLEEYKNDQYQPK